MGWLGLKFLFENFEFLPQVLSWLVGLVGLLLFELVDFLKLVVFLVGLLFRVGWLGWLGLKFPYENFLIFASCFQLVGLVGWFVF